MAAALAQSPVEQREMHRFLSADLHPLVDKGRRELIAETTDQVERKVDRDKFDMGERVEHGDARSRRPHLAAPGHLARMQQDGRVRARGLIGHRPIKAVRQPSQPPRPRDGARSHHLGMGISGQQDMAARRPDTIGQGQSAFAASSTSAACPLTFTLGQTRATTPSAPIRKVARSIPIYLRP